LRPAYAGDDVVHRASSWPYVLRLLEDASSSPREGGGEARGWLGAVDVGPVRSGDSVLTVRASCRERRSVLGSGVRSRSKSVALSKTRCLCVAHSCCSSWRTRSRLRACAGGTRVRATAHHNGVRSGYLARYTYQQRTVAAGACLAAERIQVHRRR